MFKPVQRTSEASYQYTPGKLHNDVFNFVFLDCTNCILDCTISHFGLHKLFGWTARLE